MAVGSVKESTDDVAMFVLDHLGHVPSDEIRLFFHALSCLTDGDKLVETLRARSDLMSVADDKEVAARMRYSLAALSLGRIEVVERLRVVEGDPTARTAFIRDFAHWPSRPRELAALLRGVQAPEVRSGLCLALGGVDRSRWTNEDFGALQNQLLRFYLEDPDSGVHSAAGWVLKEWQVVLPDLPRLSAPPHDPPEGGRLWYVNSLGMTMVRVPKVPKRKYRTGFEKYSGNRPREVEVASFWLSACEVTHEQLAAIRVTTKSYEARTKAASYSGVFDAQSAITLVTWFDAVQYCNLLSEREGLRPYYKISNTRRDMGSILSAQVETGVGDGYRLPTETKWGVACRAGTTTDCSFGNQVGDLGDYGWSILVTMGGWWSRRIAPIRGACTTCMAAYGSGVTMFSMSTIGRCTAAVGRAVHRPAGRCGKLNASRRTTRSTWVFVWP